MITKETFLTPSKNRVSQMTFRLGECFEREIGFTTHQILPPPNLRPTSVYKYRANGISTALHTALNHLEQLGVP